MLGSKTTHNTLNHESMNMKRVADEKECLELMYRPEISNSYS